jgi:hypothetical protein
MAFIIQIRPESCTPRLACSECNEPLASPDDAIALWLPKYPLNGADGEVQKPRTVMVDILCKKSCARRIEDLHRSVGNSCVTIGFAEFLEAWRDEGFLESGDRRAALHRLELLSGLPRLEEK